jgi:hypothetical protein
LYFFPEEYVFSRSEILFEELIFEDLGVLLMDEIIEEVVVT